MELTNAVAASASGDMLFCPLYFAEKLGWYWVATVDWKWTLYHSGAGAGSGALGVGGGAGGAAAAGGGCSSARASPWPTAAAKSSTQQAKDEAGRRTARLSSRESRGLRDDSRSCGCHDGYD